MGFKSNKNKQSTCFVDYRYEALGSGYSSGFADLGPIRWQMVLVYLLAFILVVLALSKSIKSSGKVQ